MNHKLYLLALLICNCMFASCVKEEIDSANLEGTWRSYKGELLFDGSVVLSGADALETSAVLSFSNGILTTSIDGEGGRAPYTFSNGVISVHSIIPVQFFVIELTSSNLIIDIPRGIISFGSGDWGELVATYKGRKIYRSESDIIDEYWYTSGSKMVYCEPINEENYEDGWMDTMRIYLKK